MRYECAIGHGVREAVYRLPRQHFEFLPQRLEQNSRRRRLSIRGTVYYPLRPSNGKYIMEESTKTMKNRT